MIMLDLATIDKVEPAAEAPDVQRRLRAAWRRQRRFVLTRGICYLALASCAVAAAAFVLDWRLELSPTGRGMLLGAAAAVLLAVGYAAWWRRRQAFDAARIAIQIESLYPQLHSALVSHVQLHDRTNRSEEGSPAMIRELSRRADAESKAVDFSRIIDFRRLRRPAAACLAALAVIAAWSAWRPDLVAVFAARMTRPATNVPYPTRTLLEPLTADCDVKDGDSVELKVRASGQIPEEGLLAIYPADGPMQSIRISPAEARDFAHAFEAVHRDFNYVFRVGDAVTRPAAVRVFTDPVVQPKLEIHYPAYTRRPVEIVDSLTADVLEGSQVVWRLAVDRPVQAATIHILGQKQPLKLDVSADGRAVQGSLTPARTLTYRLAWTDRGHGADGLSGLDFQPPARYILKVHPDLPPRVSLLSPTGDAIATVNKKSNIVFDASDDFGLSAARIVYAVENGDGETQESYVNIPLPAREPLEVSHGNFRWTLRQSIPGLSVGDTVRYGVEVQDNRPKVPGVARSEMRRVKIASLEEYGAWVKERLEANLGSVKQIRDEEQQSKEAVDKLRQK